MLVLVPFLVLARLIPRVIKDESTGIDLGLVTPSHSLLALATTIEYTNGLYQVKSSSPIDIMR